MNIVLLGSQGQVGREVVELGYKYNLNVIGFSHDDVDIKDINSIKNIVCNCDLLINSAAYTNVDKAEQEAALAYETNAIGAKNIASFGIPLIQLSTDYVFDGTNTKPYVETDLTNPISEYGNTKLAGEKFIQSINPRHIILRTSWVFGKYGSNFVKTILRLSKELKKIKVVDDQYGGPTSSKSIAEALLVIAIHIKDSNFNNWGIYNFSGSPNVSWYQFAEKIIQINGLSVPLEPIKSRDFRALASRPANSMLNCEKIKKVFGISQSNWFNELDNILMKENNL